MLKRFVSSLFLLCCIAVLPASADVLHDNFGAGDTYNTGTGRTLGTSSLWEQGPDFTVSGSDYFLDSLVAAIGHVTGVNQVTIDVYTSVAGLPGVVLESATVGGFPVFGAGGPPVTINFSGNTVLQNGQQYFLAARSVNDGTAWLAWNLNTTGDTGFAQRNSTSGWSYNTGTTMAFRVNGTRVPEPASACFLGLAGVIALGIKRRRR